MSDIARIMDYQPKCRFFSLLAEIRNRIYPLLFRHSGILELCRRQTLSSEFLRTCKSIHNEGVAILYGENTFRLEIQNIHANFPYLNRFHSAYALHAPRRPTSCDT